MHSQSLLIRVVASLLVFTANAFAQPGGESPRYLCPHLHNASMQKLSPMSQGKEGWFFRKVELRDNYALLPQTQRNLARLVRAFEYFRGAKLVVVAVPPKALIMSAQLLEDQPMQQQFDVVQVRERYADYLQMLQRSGAVVVNPMERMVQGFDGDINAGGQFYFKRDHHWMPYGAELTARAIAKELQKEAQYTAISKTHFSTERERQSELKHIMAQELQRLCEISLPAEPYDVFVTYPRKQKGAAALFGDQQAQEGLVLVGSSFSAMEEFNFAGFISQYTGLAVSNYAISAGQLFNALLSYVSKSKERVEPSPYILWEVLPQYEMNNNSTLFRQIIPAVAGDCKVGNDVKFNTNRSDFDNNLKIINFTKEQKIYGNSYYFLIEDISKNIKKLTVELDYDNGDGEIIPIDQRENYEPSGRYFIELSDEIISPLKQVKVFSKPKNIEALSVKLCKYDSNFSEGERGLDE